MGLMKFARNQLQAIKRSAAGKMPKFISGGNYSDENVKASVGGSMKVGKTQIGGTIGLNRGKKGAFGSYNVNGKIKKRFGYQGE